MNKKEIKKLRQEYDKTLEQLRKGTQNWEMCIFLIEKRSILRQLLNGNLTPTAGVE